jgi:hypothetical protein
MKRAKEKRDARRIRVELPVCLSSGEGVTRDISSSGVFFRTDRDILPGDGIRFSLELAYAFDKAIRLQCRGRVVRVEKGAAGMGVAARITGLRVSA